MPNEITDAAARSAKATKSLDTMRARIVKADEARTDAAHQARAAGGRTQCDSMGCSTRPGRVPPVGAARPGREGYPGPFGADGGRYWSTIVRRKPESTRLFRFTIYNTVHIFLAGSPRF